MLFSLHGQKTVQNVFLWKKNNMRVSKYDRISIFGWTVSLKIQLPECSPEHNYNKRGLRINTTWGLTRLPLYTTLENLIWKTSQVIKSSWLSGHWGPETPRVLSAESLWRRRLTHREPCARITQSIVNWSISQQLIYDALKAIFTVRKVQLYFPAH